ncbi:MAG: bifunctional phosphopantothenoylcysteine decarboxylase/phosphopantothenate--cysteine ligase CoaBC [Candidatus Saccharicenans sp.]|jgi:phosphopantothenoylcysteine decarboxylase/phosphopantothenate--cysteine ligase|nr:bifunctional phosphopantothenoylcysteine decarboxylase/phosphopantothenate--cysteine ligase CoaBC [Candidatus Saccharicenans sp.]MDH7492300.1 bifunctional phosphopantothenoylcysteine decarboxylase/phosphopantothenate--cysteine ligase CoaBC [Candidatus Saccharicenans sp.]
MKKIALGVCSSVSLYKACEIIRLFQSEGFGVRVIMTEKATRFIDPYLFTSLTGERTIVHLFDDQQRPIEHISLVDEINLLLLAPATANVIGKMASGIADDFLTTFYLAAKCPVLVAPAMNEAMYLHPQTQENIRKLKSLGVEFVEPDTGYLACGKKGPGRLAVPEKIVQQGLRLIRTKDSFRDKVVLVTAGPTREFLDPVRFVSNPASGKMGYELAGEAYQLGAEVILISGPTYLEPPAGVYLERVTDAAEMKEAVLRHYDRAEVVLMAAAVADFRFRKTWSEKIRKTEIERVLEIETTPDILEELGQRKGHQLLVGFAAETGQAVEKALEKMKRKQVDLIVANDVSRPEVGFGSDENEVVLLWPDGRTKKIPRASKRKISQEILAEIEVLLNERKGKS